MNDYENERRCLLRRRTLARVHGVDLDTDPRLPGETDEEFVARFRREREARKRRKEQSDGD